MQGSHDPENVVVTGRKDWTVPRSVAPLWRHQSSLPRLPVPVLYLTCLRYLRTLKPLLSDEEFASASNAIVDFAMGGDGQRLQSRLLARAKANPDSSWLIEWWNDYAYLTDPGPVVFFVSYFYAFKDLVPFLAPRPAQEANQLGVASALVAHALAFREEVASGSLLPDMAGGTTPQCSAMYSFLFNACRIPGTPLRDKYATYPPTSANSHVIVIRKRRFVRVDAGGLSLAELQSALAKAVEAADLLGGDPSGIGALTSGGREAWGRARGSLCSGEHRHANMASLQDIQSAALAVCMDEEGPPEGESGRMQRARQYWHGDGRNRFFDKTLQFIVAPNGRAGFLGEHALSDGSPTARMCDVILTRIAKGGCGSFGTTPGAGGGAVKELPIIPCGGVKQAVAEAERKFDETVEQHSVAVVSTFGRDSIRKLGVPPDAFIQSAIQLAFHRHSGGRPAATYEASSTRSFLHGRTETIRSCSIETIAFAKAMESATASPAQRLSLLKDALAAHREYSVRCSRAQGVDRHLLGLKMLVKEGETLPAIFAHPSFDKSRTWELSTSTLSCDYFESWGFGEVCDHGFGIGYTVNKGEATFVITCRADQAGGKGRADDLGQRLVAALAEMRDLCTAEGARQGGRASRL